jgi:hypothetical protein
MNKVATLWGVLVIETLEIAYVDDMGGIVWEYGIAAVAPL